MRGRTLAFVVALAGLAVPATAAADRTYNILPPGENGGFPLNAFSNDQAKLYDKLTPKRGNVTANDLRTLYKPENLDPVGPTTVEPTPRVGLTLKRDAHDVPHIYGRTQADVWYGVGWVAAEDRGLLLSQGRGPARAAVADVPGLNAFGLVTSLRSFTPSAQTEALVTSEQQKLVQSYGTKGGAILRDMDAYGDGINAYFKAKGQAFPTWTRNDTISFFAFIGSIFGNGGGSEASNDQLLADLRKRLGRDRGIKVFQDVMEAQNPEAPTTTAKRFPFGSSSGRATTGSPLIDPGSFSGVRNPAESRRASNFLVVNDSRAGKRASLAVMGPQLGYFAPEIVFEADLHGPGIRAQGAIPPGTGPYLLLGRTQDYAWSITTAENDNQDAFLEQLCGTDGRHYVYKSKCVAMTSFDAGALGASSTAPAKELVYDLTVHGPVIGHATIHGRRYAVSRNRSTRGQDVNGIAALRDMTLGRGATTQGFFDSANEFGFTFNWAYASRRHTAYFSSGRIPRAEKGLNELLPRLGTGAYDWKGFLRRDEHPHDVDPKGGLFLNWNNKPAPGWMQGDNVHSYGSVHRMELFKGFPRATRLEDVVSIMNRAATQDLRTVEVWPVIRAVLGRSHAPNARTARAVALVDAWRRHGSSRLDANLDGKIDDPGAAVMDRAFVPIAHAVMDPVLGPQAAELAGLQDVDEPPYRDGGNGSSFGGGWYGYVDKDLRTLLGQRVRGRFGVRYCGRGSLTRCRAALWRALDKATAGLSPGARADATKERIDFQPGLVVKDTMRWTNRPTFQQVLELDRR